MAIRRFRLRGFRNLEDSDLSFSSRVSVLIGNNAQGKTNFLEALHLLSNLRSFRTRRLSDLLGPGASTALLSGEIDGAAGPVDLAVTVTAQARTALRQGRLPGNAAEYLLSFPSVLFGPGDMELSQGDQELRRAYLDRATFLTDPSHLSRLRDYGRILKHRNALLRHPSADLDLWDEQLAAAGAALRVARQRTLAGLQPIVSALHAEIAGGEDRLEIYWERPAEQDGGREPRDQLLESLFKSRARDRDLGYTTAGPHRDRLCLEVNGREVRHHGSRGQHRTVALSFKLALLRWSSDQAEEPPVFLVDDPGPELDPPRLSYLGKALSQWSGQVFLTCTDASTVPLSVPDDVALYRVEAGRIRLT